MKTKLILFDTPILVSDEEVCRGHWAIRHLNEVIQIDSRHTYPYNKYGWIKIIAGIPEYPVIDYNGFEEQLGIIDVVKIVQEKIGIENLPDDDWKIKFGIECFKACQSLNKNKFSEEDMRKAWEEGIHSTRFNAHRDGTEFNDFDEFMKSISQPKQIEVKVEMTEDPISDFVKFNPKITNNTIKITKVIK